MDDGDRREQILRLEARIDELADAVESCRKMMLIAKVAIAAGGLLILAIALGIIRFDAMAMVAAIAAVIGGAVLFGSSKSTSQEATAAMRAAEAQRTDLIGAIDLQVVGESNSYSPSGDVRR